MTNKKELSLLSLPDDMLRVISEYCDLRTRCAVTCINSTALSSVLLGRVALSKRGSERFIKNNRFRLRICQRVVPPSRNLHLKLKINAVKNDAHIVILNSVRSVLLYAGNSNWNSAKSHQIPRIQMLTELNLGNSDFSDLTLLADLKSLTKLNLWRTQVSDLSALAGLTNLTYLDLNSTPVSDVSALAGLTNLRILSLTATQVSDVSPLAGLTNLRILSLGITKVSDVSPLAGLAKLHISR